MSTKFYGKGTAIFFHRRSKYGEAGPLTLGWRTCEYGGDIDGDAREIGEVKENMKGVWSGRALSVTLSCLAQQGRAAWKELTPRKKLIMP